MNVLKPFTLLILITQFSNLMAGHILGVEMNYICLGGNSIEIELVLYRNCLSNSDGQQWANDPESYIFIQDSNGDYITIGGDQSILVPKTSTVDIDPNVDDVCVSGIPENCVEKQIFSKTVNISPIEGGYTIIWQRCCRTALIENIVVPDNTGTTYELFVPHYPGSNCDNSSPVFNEVPPLVICADYPQYFDYSATDADGDSLVYVLCDPLYGADTNCPQPGSCTNIPYDYGVTTWEAGYSTQNQLGNSANPMTVNPQTGLLTVFPDETGYYVTTVCVEEYRDGVLIGTSKRDFTFIVTNCDIVSAVPSSDAIPIGDGLYTLTDCDSYTVNFENVSVGASSYLWDFGDLTTTTDVSTLTDPSYIYPDTGSYVIRLIANPNETCTDTAFLTLNLYPGEYNVDFAINGDLCAGSAIDFTDESYIEIGEILAWDWDFGDGTVLSDQDPTHTFTEPGLYPVLLSTYSDLGCEAVHSMVLYVEASPEVVITTSDPCGGGAIEFTATPVDGNAIYNYQWTFNNAIASNNEDEAVATASFDVGSYNVNLLVSSLNGCAKSYDYPISIYPDFSVSAGQDISYCLGETGQLNASLTDGNPNVDYLIDWSPMAGLSENGTFNPIVNVSQTTDYLFAISDPNGCTHTDIVTVTVNPLPSLQLAEDTTLCSGQSAVLALGIDNQTNTVLWYPPTGLNSDTLINPIATPLISTNYTVTATNTFSCTATSQIQVDVQESILPMPLVDAEICLGETATLSTNGGLYYEWSSNVDPAMINSASVTVSPESTTTYSVIISNDCFDSIQEATITVHELPIVNAGEDVLINLGESTQLIGSTDATQYAWTPITNLNDATILNPTSDPETNTTYTLTATSDQGCVNADDVYVEVNNIFDILVPTAFSPNGDGVNDFFGVVTKGMKSIEKVQVYNRWGELLYDGSGLDFRWDGNLNGVPQEIGVYVYHISGTALGEGKTVFKKGNLTLIR